MLPINARRLLGALAILTLAPWAVPMPAAGATAVQIAGNLLRPLYVTQAPGDFERLFIVEQNGRIRILLNGALLDSAFLNVDPISSCCGERGLLGLAFHPDYQNNGYFYINYTNTLGNTVIARFSVTGDPNIADPGSAVTIKTYTQPEANHNGGCLQFGPDGMLYVSSGDGGGSNDQHGTTGNGQNLNTLLGKILRLDVDTTSPYVPADNPFVGLANHREEIWAYGVRNPWRFTFDRLTGDMYMADVGQDAREEINFEPDSAVGGRNYGWRCMEGTNCTGLTGCTCNGPTLTLPIHEYPHQAACQSITGGYVYRGCALPELEGHYFYAEYCTGQIWSFRYDGATRTDSTEWTATLDPAGFDEIVTVSSFGQDHLGELYICDYGDGEVYKIVPDAFTDCNANLVADSCEIAAGMAADVNGNQVPDDCECACPCAGDPACDGVSVNVLDVVETVNVAFRGAAPTSDTFCPYERSDVDCTGATTVTDVVRVVNVAFRGGMPQTEFCAPCP
jgi:glucose/arabinose dehydrogenase